MSAVRSAFDEQLLGEAMAALPPRVWTAWVDPSSRDFCKGLITEAKLYPAAAQRRSFLREVHALFEGTLEGLFAPSHPLAPALQPEMCASPFDYKIDDWEASVGAFAQGLVARASLVKSRVATFVRRFPEARPVYKEPGEIL